jgi:hypothetical protein
VLWWLIVVAIPVIEAIYWIWAIRLPPVARALAAPRQIPASLTHLLLLVFALSQVGGFVGEALAPISQGPAWFYALLILFLLFEIVVFVSLALRRAWPRLMASRRRSAPTTKPLAQSKP